MTGYNKFMRDIIKALSVAQNIPVDILVKNLDPELSRYYCRLLELERARIKDLQKAFDFESIYKEWLSEEIKAGRIKEKTL